MTLAKFINNFLEPFSYLLYLLAVSLQLGRNNNKTLPVLFVFYAVATTLLTIACFHIYTDTTNIWAYNLVLPTAMLALGYYFYQTLSGRAKKRTIAVLLAVALVYYGVNNVVWGHFKELDSIGLVLLAVLVSVGSFMYFHQILTHVKEGALFSDFDFWLVSSYLIYYLGSFFIFLCYNYFTASIMQTYRDADRLTLAMLWGVHNVSLFVGAVIALAGSIWTIYRNRLRSS